MNSYYKFFVIIQIVFYAFFIEFLIFLGFKIKKMVNIAKKIYIISFNIKDEYIVSWINRVLYKGVLGVKFFHGNCQRYVLLLVIFFHQRYKHLKVILGISKKNGKIEGHVWLENCNKLFYEPYTTLQEYKSIMEFEV